MPKISVIIPVYNTEKYLKKCLDSILNQTFTDFEAICINDGSTDGSAQILAEYSSKDSRIKVITQQNKGQSVARNKGLDIAKGDYIYFVDSDDFIHNQTLEIMLKIAIKTKSPVVSQEKIIQLSKHSINQEEYDLNTLKYRIHKKPLQHILNNSWSNSVIWNKLYKREILDNKKFIEGICFEDWCFITCLFSDITTYTSVPYELYFYNDCDYSTVRSTFSLKKLEDYEVGIRFTNQYFKKANKEKYWNIVRKKRISVSIKMMINKVYRETINHPELVKKLIKTITQLHSEKIFYYKNLSFKILLRFYKMYRKGY